MQFKGKKETTAKIKNMERQSSTNARVWIAVSERTLKGKYLENVIEMFDKLGYERVNGSAGDEWDVLWSLRAPFTDFIKGRLQPHQRVNHFPASGFITGKATLATTKLKGIPKAFRIPRDKDKFLKYVKEHPDKLWIKKRNSHRGIKVQNVSSMNLTEEGFFVQEFIQNPLLVDGYKFDIGVYVVMTSVDPLRVYVMGNEIFFHCFCLLTAQLTLLLLLFHR